MHRPTQIIGHRGNPTRYPDNSLAGILDAIEIADMVEIDVRRTVDGTLVLSHDAQIGGRALIEHPANSFDVVEFDDLLPVVGDFPLNIEIKNDPSDPDFDPSFETAHRIAERARTVDLITSFHWPTVDAVRSLRADVRTGLLVDRGWNLEQAIDAAVATGHDAVAPHWSLLEDAPAIRERAGELAVNVWTVNDVTLARRLMDANITAIITDDPATMVALTRESSAMSIKEELQSELTDALRSKDKARLDVIRQITTEATKASTEPGFAGELDDDLYTRVIASYTKKMNKARAEYESYGERGAEMAAKLAFETEYLSRWLPEAASPDELREIVAAAIDRVGATDASQIGRVIGHVMKGNEGLDGAQVSDVAREMLSS